MSAATSVTTGWVVTLIGQSVTPAAVHAVSSAVAAVGGTAQVRPLGDGPVAAVALDVCEAPDGDRLRAAVAAASDNLAEDVAVVGPELTGPGRRLIVTDVDSTFIRGEVIEMLAAHAGREAEVRAVTEAAMRGELDFAESLHRRVAVLEGLDVRVLDEVRAGIRLTPGARELCAAAGRLDYEVALVSGGFAEIVEPIAAAVGITMVRANRLEVADGRLTGTVLGAVVDRAAKAAALRDFAAAEQVPLSRTVAVGDGANDLDMIAAAGLGVAFLAKPVVQAQAGAAINVPRLDAVLHLLGCTRDEIEPR